MRLPNGDKAVIDECKLVDYSLNPDHPVGKHKARVFRAALGLTQSDAPLLRQSLLEAAHSRDAATGRLDEHGQRYQIDFEMDGPNGTVPVRSVWIIPTSDDTPRLITCYVLE